MIMKLRLVILFLLVTATLSAQTAVPDWFRISGNGHGVSLPMRGEPEAQHDMALVMAVADYAIKNLRPEDMVAMTEYLESGYFKRVCRWMSDITFSYDLIKSYVNDIGEEYVMIQMKEGDECHAEIACDNLCDVTGSVIEEEGELVLRLEAGTRKIIFYCTHSSGLKSIMIEGIDASTDEFYSFQDTVNDKADDKSASYHYGDYGFASLSCSMVSCANSMFCAFMNALMWHGPFEITGIKDNNLYFINY